MEVSWARSSAAPRPESPLLARGGLGGSRRGHAGDRLYPEDSVLLGPDLPKLKRASRPDWRNFIKKQGLPLATSWRSIYIYGQFLVLPFLCVLIWILLPIIDFYSWSIISGAYFCYSFLIWQVWFDILIPGCSQIQIQLFNFIFLAGLVGWYTGMKITKIDDQKLAYTLAAFYGLLLNLFCFTIHFWRTRAWKQPTTYDSLPIQADIAATKDELNPEDQTMVEIADIQKLFKEKDVHCSRWFYNLFCFIEWIDWNRKQESSAANVNITSWGTLLWGFLYRILLFGIWAWLQFFTEFVVQLDVFRNSFFGILALCLYQLVRVIILKIMFALNDRLPAIKELKYFSQFAVPFMLYLYYRNIFLAINQWWVVIAVSVIVIITQFLLYPIQMSYYVYHLRFVTLKRKIEGSGKKWRKALAEAIAPSDVDYEAYLTSLTVEYYFDEIATYISIVATFILFPIIRYSYNRAAYKLIDTLSDPDFKGLMLRYLYLFAAEVAGDILIKLILYFIHHINAPATARNLTVLNYRTRFLFGIFVVWLMTSTYYSMVRLGAIV